MAPIVIVLLFLAGPTASGPDRLCIDKVKIKAVVKLYAMSGRGEALLRALARFENGNPGNECGHDNNRTNQEPYGTACLPAGSEGYARGAVAINKAMQQWILSDGYRRKELLKFFANWYHSSIDPDRNDAYRKTLGTLHSDTYRGLCSTAYDPRDMDDE